MWPFLIHAVLQLQCNNTNISPLARVERNYEIMGFSDKLVKVPIKPSMELHDATTAISRVTPRPTTILITKM